MGEKIRDITKLHLGGGSFMLELNEPLQMGRERQIHIQNDKFRFECAESDILAMLCGVVGANKELEKLKRGNDADVLWKSK